MLIMTLLLILISACTTANNPQTIPQVPGCELKPIKVPALPSVIPEYLEIDSATGLHMTGTAQEIDFSSYRLLVTGLVEEPLSLTFDELRCLSKVTTTASLKCSGIFEDFEDIATWSGTPIFEILQLAKPLPEANSLAMVSADGFKMNIDLETAMNPENFLAYELEGQPIPVLHGFPLRSVFPNKDGSYWVKWLVELKVE